MLIENLFLKRLAAERYLGHEQFGLARLQGAKQVMGSETRTPSTSWLPTSTSCWDSPRKPEFDSQHSATILVWQVQLKDDYPGLCGGMRREPSGLPSVHIVV